MNKKRLFVFVVILICASLLAACGQPAVATAAPTAPGALASASPAPTVPGALASASPAPTATASPAPTTPPLPVLSLVDCKLLSMQDIGTILGGAIVHAREEIEEMPGAQNKNTLCVYQTGTVKLELTFIDPTGAPGGTQGLMQTTRKMYGNSVDIPGLGDDAFQIDLHGFLELFLRKADSSYSIGLRSVTSAGDADTSPVNAQAMEKALAELLLSHLP